MTWPWETTEGGEGGGGGTIGGGTPSPSPSPTPSPTPTPPPPPLSEAIQPDIVASSIDSAFTIAFQRIPLGTAPSQVVVVQLGLQSCRIAVYQKRTGLYLDLYKDDVAIVTGVLCRDRVWLIRNAYLGFNGDLTFVDNQGLDDPGHTGLGGRFDLLWGSAS